MKDAREIALYKILTELLLSWIKAATIVNSMRRHCKPRVSWLKMVNQEAYKTVCAGRPKSMVNRDGSAKGLRMIFSRRKLFLAIGT